MTLSPMIAEPAFNDENDECVDDTRIKMWLVKSTKHEKHVRQYVYGIICMEKDCTAHSTVQYDIYFYYSEYNI